MKKNKYFNKRKNKLKNSELTINLQLEEAIQIYSGFFEHLEEHPRKIKEYTGLKKLIPYVKELAIEDSSLLEKINRIGLYQRENSIRL